MTGLVKAHISHRTAIENHTEIEAVLKEYETHQENYIALLEDNGYSSIYATAELTIIKIILEELHRGTCVLQEYLTCGIFPSEKIVGGLAKLIAPYMRTGSGNKNAKICKSVLEKLIPLLFLKHYHDASLPFSKES
jgi:glutathione synthase/RimK-type ligase-like ATP-grasp enzyme